METPETLNISSLTPTDAFEKLTEKEKLYAYYMSQASQAGSAIVAKQISPESYALMSEFLSAFCNDSVTNMRSKLTEKFNEYNTNQFLNYFANVLGNLSNYTSFGDTKFVPRLAKELFASMCNFLGMHLDIETVYDVNTTRLDYYPDGVTCYTTPNMTKEEVAQLNQFMVDNQIEFWNTRLSKEGNGYIIHIASVNERLVPYGMIGDKQVFLQYGDYSDELRNVVECLQHALNYVANDNQRRMLECYIRHFTTGNIEDHKESQMHWVRDKGPSVETNLGFIENYRDPSGVRAEFESFVTIVDKNTSLKFAKLVDLAPMFINRLPWPKEFEQDVFRAPDFTSLEVVTFVTSGIPAGINIPNYHDVKSKYGFKNVSLGNIIRSAYNSPLPTQFVTSEDDLLYKKYNTDSFEMGVGSHELIGHGTGKLFIEGEFDAGIVNPLTGKPVTSWYKKGESYSSRFGQLSSAYEECRAECVALLLSTMDEMYDIFGISDQGERDNLMYISWLSMIRAGLASCFAYDMKKSRWTQAHSQARYVIYRVLNEVSGFIRIDMEDNNFVIHLDRKIIKGQGLNALNRFLLKLQVYKSTGDISSAQAMFDSYSDVDENIHKIVEANKRPRSIIVQPSMFIGQDDSVNIKTYPATVDGMIESMVDNLTEWD